MQNIKQFRNAELKKEVSRKGAEEGMGKDERGKRRKGEKSKRGKKQKAKREKEGRKEREEEREGKRWIERTFTA